MLLKLAWRNIWRNKRRSLITITSIVMAVFLSNFMISINEGMFNNMLDNMTRSFLGHVQVHQNGYWDEQNLDNSLSQSKELLQTLEQTNHVEAVAPRIESFALASFGTQTHGAMIVGLVPEREVNLMNVESRIVAGKPISSTSNGVLVGDELADFLNLSVGDTLVLLGQGYHGVSAAGKFEVVGLIQMPSPQLNANLVVMPLAKAQFLYGAESLLTSYTLVIDDQNHLEKVKTSLISTMDTSALELLTWPEMMPEMVQMKTTKVAGTYIYVGILYLIAGFGIFATVLMMMAERSYELGVMLSVGMSRFRLTSMMVLETLFISILGVSVGTLMSYPAMYAMKVSPIAMTGPQADAMLKMGFEPLMITSTEPSIFITNALILFVISCLIVAYPTLVIWKMNAVKSMHK